MIRSVTFIGVGLVLCSAAVPQAQSSDPQYVLLRTSRHGDFQRQIQQAADHGYRVAATFFESGLGVVLARAAGDAVPVEYLVLSTRKTGTLSREIDMAAAAGFRLTCVLGGKTVLMERPKGAARRTHQYQVLASEQRQTMEEELRGPAAVGFQVVGQTLGSGVLLHDSEFVAILERPVDPARRIRRSYLVIDAVRVGTRQRELQDAADRGYRLIASGGVWGSAALLERVEDAGEPRFEYLVLSTKRIDTMQQEMDAAAVRGFHFASLLGGNMKGETAIVMERERGAADRIREQRLFLWKGFRLTGRRNPDAERDLLAELVKGFRLVGQGSFARFMSATGSDAVLILERDVGNPR